MTKRQRLELCCLLMLLGFVAAVGFCYWEGYYQGLSYPDGTYLFRPNDRFKVDQAPVITQDHFFSDLYTPWYQARAGDIYHAVPGKFDFRSNYPPLTNVLLFPLAILPYPAAYAIYALSFLAFLIWFAAIEFRTDHSPGGWLLALIPILLAYPVHVCFDRGNLECWAFMATAVAFVCYRREQYGWSAMLIAVAANLKIFPLLFVAQFWVDRRYREAGLCVAIAAALCLLSFAILPGRLIYNLHGFWGMLFAYSHDTADAKGMFFGTSLRGVIYTALILCKQVPGVVDLLLNAFQNYIWISVTMLGLCMLALLRRQLVLWQSTLLLTAAMVLLPPASADYRLLYFFIPLAMFFDATVDWQESVLFTVLCSLLLISFAYWHPQEPFERTPGVITISSMEWNSNVVVHPLIELTIMLLLLKRAFGKPAGSR